MTFTAAEKAELGSAFPDGVCDYRRPGPQERPPIGSWLNYSRGTTPFPVDDSGGSGRRVHGERR